MDNYYLNNAVYLMEDFLKKTSNPRYGGEVLYGDIDDADLVKIHLQSGKLTLLKYEDYDASPLPKLKQRIKIRLRDQDIEFFDY